MRFSLVSRNWYHWLGYKALANKLLSLMSEWVNNVAYPAFGSFNAIQQIIEEFYVETIWK